MLLKLLINPKSMIFSLVLGFEGKKIEEIIYRRKAKFCAALVCSNSLQY